MKYIHKHSFENAAKNSIKQYKYFMRRVWDLFSNNLKISYYQEDNDDVVYLFQTEKNYAYVYTFIF